APHLRHTPLKTCACSLANWSKVRAGCPVTRVTISDTPDARPAAKTTYRETRPSAIQSCIPIARIASRAASGETLTYFAVFPVAAEIFEARSENDSASGPVIS